MAKIAGSVDGRGRPLVRIRTGDDDLLAVIYTGFNGDLMITELSARFLKLENGLNASKIELGDGTIAEVFRTETKLNWLGEDRYVRVLISQGWVAAPDEPAALVGTGLLTPHLLLVDFGRATIEIETQ